MQSTARLTLIRSRFAALSSGGAVSGIDSFHPIPRNRFDDSPCGGVVWKKTAPIPQDEPISADFVASPVEEYKSLLSDGLNAAELAAVDMESAAVSFESDFDSNPIDFSPDSKGETVTQTIETVRISPILSRVEKTLEKLANDSKIIAESHEPLALVSIPSEFEALRLRVLSMAGR
jgi:hypothetical protein